MKSRSGRSRSNTQAWHVIDSSEWRQRIYFRDLSPEGLGRGLAHRKSLSKHLVEPSGRAPEKAGRTRQRIPFGTVGGVNVAKSPTEQIRELSVQVGILMERDAARRNEIDDLKVVVEKERDARIVSDRPSSNNFRITSHSISSLTGGDGHSFSH